MMAKYDVFISFKNTDSEGKPSRDAKMADLLYKDLKSRGIKVFFSKYSIDEAARADYVDAIDEALESALLLVAVGTSKKNLTSQWVKAEINQFRTLVNTDEEGRRSIASFRSKDYPESELPSGIKSYQSFVDRHALVRFIEVFLQKDSSFQRKEDVTSLLCSVPNATVNKSSTDILWNSDEQISDVDRCHFTDKYLCMGDLLDNTYRILGKVGQGGMSSVYLAFHERANRMYAAKEIRKDGVLDFDTIISSFRIEIDMLKKMNHPAIPRVVDVFYKQDSVILVSDFIEGDSLYKILNEAGPLSEEKVLDIARQLCQVLTYLHTLSPPVIYRDMKPSNVIIRPDGKVMLIDFGTAREYKVNKLEDTTCLGTIGFAAPEQFGGMGQTDARSDIYNLGVTLYSLVTGRNPAEPPYEIKPIRQIDPNLSRALEAIILKCVQRDPDRRFQSAQELLDALDNITKFARQSALRSFFHLRPNSSSNKKPKHPNMPMPKPYRIPEQPTEGLFETTVLSPNPDRAPIRPMSPVASAVSAPFAIPSKGFSVPGQPTTQPTPPLPPTPFASKDSLPKPVDMDQAGYFAPPPEPPPPVLPRPLEIPAQVAPTASASTEQKKQSVPKKVTVHSKSGSHQELEETIKKLLALDPNSQRIIRDLIDRLSQ